MKAAALWLSAGLFLIVILGALRAIVEPRPPFFRKFADDTRHAYTLLSVFAGLLFIFGYPGLQVDSVEVAGVKATVVKLEKKVDTLASQMEEFFKRKKVETFDSHNWNEIRTVSQSGKQFVLEVTLQDEPIPGSIEVYEGVLLMPEEAYRPEGRVLQFPANTNKPVVGLTIKYYPRVRADQ